jgi:hypothetical protein
MRLILAEAEFGFEPPDGHLARRVIYVDRNDLVQARLFRFGRVRV